MIVKGVRDIRTLRGQIHRVFSRTRAQAAAELAYLEHEKDRLERELGIWIANQKQTESRFHSVRQRIAELQAMLKEESPGDSRAVHARRAKAGGGRPRASCREVALEY